MSETKLQPKGASLCLASFLLSFRGPLLMDAFVHFGHNLFCKDCTEVSDKISYRPVHPETALCAYSCQAVLGQEQPQGHALLSPHRRLDQILVAIQRDPSCTKDDHFVSFRRRQIRWQHVLVRHTSPRLEACELQLMKQFSMQSYFSHKVPR